MTAIAPTSLRTRRRDPSIPLARRRIHLSDGNRVRGRASKERKGIDRNVSVYTYASHVHVYNRGDRLKHNKKQVGVGAARKKGAAKKHSLVPACTTANCTDVRAGGGWGRNPLDASNRVCGGPDIGFRLLPVPPPSERCRSNGGHLTPPSQPREEFPTGN